MRKSKRIEVLEEQNRINQQKIESIEFAHKYPEGIELVSETISCGLLVRSKSVRYVTRGIVREKKFNGVLVAKDVSPDKYIKISKYEFLICSGEKYFFLNTESDMIMEINSKCISDDLKKELHEGLNEHENNG